MFLLKLLSFVPDKTMLKWQYKIQLGRKLNIKNPTRYTEKLQWYKLYYHNPVMTQCVDKYEVRDYVKSKGLEHILNELYAVYEIGEKIDFESLPQSFAIKTTNGSGTNLFVKNKNDVDLRSLEKEIKTFSKRPHKSAGREWAYNNVKNRIVVEKLLVDEENEFGGINDYKILCFNGKVECIIVDVSRFSNHRRNFYSTEWERLTVESDHPNFEPDIERPKNLEEMLRIAEILSQGFPEVRVDLYNISGTIIFGELTFYPWSGYVKFIPDEYDYCLGTRFDISKKYKKEN